MPAEGDGTSTSRMARPDYGDGVELSSRSGVEFINECEVGLDPKSRLAWM